ncbi:hypothetical protein C2G38_2226503 [Gigaspora rosea]|uniref:Uncharacterized protein n=1 Tax=Gigaspora rosea TaxID=44941 RepID=A0A397U1J7_9GLOM|nr:hypothetical protein C2G38_2226503 [Gigaspora rosea]
MAESESLNFEFEFIALSDLSFKESSNAKFGKIIPDYNTLKNLFEDWFLNISPTSSDKVDISLQASSDKIFWNCFRNSYDVYLRGINGKVRILSIIAENLHIKN